MVKRCVGGALSLCYGRLVFGLKTVMKLLCESKSDSREPQERERYARLYR